MSATTVRAPYEIGDKFSALYLDPERGTCLGTFTVTYCLDKGWRDAEGQRVWEVQGRAGEHLTHGIVRSNGTDRNGYIRSL